MKNVPLSSLKNKIEEGHELMYSIYSNKLNLWEENMKNIPLKFL
jgi:hypothetical protein